MLNLATVAPWLQNQGVYGPVTATLDWCEVRIRTRLLSKIIESWIGQLSILALYRWDGEYLLKHLYDYFGVVRWFAGDEGTFTVEIPLRLRGLSLSFLYFVPSKTFITGRRSSWPRQSFLSCNTPLRSSTCRWTSHDLRRLNESLSRLWQQTGFWVTIDAFQSSYCAFSIIWRSFYLELVSVLSFFLLCEFKLDYMRPIWSWYLPFILFYLILLTKPLS